MAGGTGGKLVAEAGQAVCPLQVKNIADHWKGCSGYLRLVKREASSIAVAVK